MPVIRKKMRALKERYGEEKGERIYYALEQKEKSRKKGKRRKKGDPISRAAR